LRASDEEAARIRREAAGEADRNVERHEVAFTGRSGRGERLRIGASLALGLLTGSWISVPRGASVTTERAPRFTAAVLLSSNGGCWPANAAVQSPDLRTSCSSSSPV
jgi:hypothetical protein